MHSILQKRASPEEKSKTK